MSGVAFVLYRQVYQSGSLIVDQNGYDLGSRVALQVYEDRAVAQARLAELLRVARRAANPFAFQNAVEASGVLALGVRWLSTPRAEWERWYDAEAPHLTDAEREKVWALFDARPLYGIHEVPLGDG